VIVIVLQARRLSADHTVRYHSNTYNRREGVPVPNKHYAMKKYRGVHSTYSVWTSALGGVVSITPRPFHPQKIEYDTHWIWAWVSRRTGLGDMTKIQLLGFPAAQPIGAPTGPGESVYC
jgi:hypothetical protein